MQTTSFIEVRLSRLSGNGAFARFPIEAGTIVHPLTGNILPRADIPVGCYDRPILQIDEDLFLEANGGADDYINHSCDPNLSFTQDGKAFYALRPIRRGEELTFDYATSEEDTQWKVKCLCGSKNCRGVITGFPALGAADQARLYPHCLPYLRKKYTEIQKNVA